MRRQCDLIKLDLSPVWPLALQQWTLSAVSYPASASPLRVSRRLNADLVPTHVPVPAPDALCIRKQAQQGSVQSWGTIGGMLVHAAFAEEAVADARII